MISDNQAKSLAWALTSLRIVYGPNRPVHVEGHMRELEIMLSSWADQKLMKTEMLTEYKVKPVMGKPFLDIEV